MSENHHPGGGFEQLGIAPKLLAVLAKLKFTTPTPIQAQAIPIAITGKDVVGIAQTGTGKTLAFGLPMIQRLARSKGRGLVVLPTRELALQVDETMQKVGRELGLKTAVLIGGTGMGAQISALNRNPHVIVATPGRLIDHLQQRTVRLDNVNVVVLDEADRMLDMGFAPQLAKIFHAVPKERQTMLFSATMPPEIMKMAAGHMQLPVRVEVAPAGTTADRVTQELFIVHRNDKTQLLEVVLGKHKGTCLIFTRTKHGASNRLQVSNRFTESWDKHRNTCKN
jgi:ATP-dependent RNA helicase RhlE